MGNFPSYIVPHSEGLVHKDFDLCLGDVVEIEDSDYTDKIVGFMYDDHECDVLLICKRGERRTFNAERYEDLTTFEEDDDELLAVDYIDELLGDMSYSFKWVESCKVELLERNWLKFWNL